MWNLLSLLEVNRSSEFPTFLSLKCLRPLLNKDQISDKALRVRSIDIQGYNTFGMIHISKKVLYSAEGDFVIALGLYINDFEIANPLGNSKNTKSVQYIGCWQIMPPNSTLLSQLVQGALLCKVAHFLSQHVTLWHSFTH